MFTMCLEGAGLRVAHALKCSFFLSIVSTSLTVYIQALWVHMQPLHKRCMHMNTHTHTHTNINICRHSRMHASHTHTHTHTHTYIAAVSTSFFFRCTLTEVQSTITSVRITQWRVQTCASSITASATPCIHHDNIMSNLKSLIIYSTV